MDFYNGNFSLKYVNKAGKDIANQINPQILADFIF